MNYKKLSFFAALCFFLSAIEAAIPKPVPFFRIGMANLPVMFALYYMTSKEASLLIILKVLLQGIVSGTLFSYIFLFSLAGSMASGFGMMGLYSLLKRSGSNLISWIGISLWGGLLNNIAQLVCAYFMMFGKGVTLIAPFMLLVSFVTSLIMGVFSCVFEEKSHWLKSLDAPRHGSPAISSSEQSEGMSVSEDCNAGKVPEKQILNVLYVCLLFCAMLWTVFAWELWEIYVLMGLFIFGCLLQKRRVRVMPSLMVIISVTVLSLLSPYGKVLCSIGNFDVTYGALTSGLLHGGKLCAMVFGSRCMMVKGLKLPWKLGTFLEDVMAIFGKLSGERLDFKSRGLIRALDIRLCEVWETMNDEI